MALEKFEAVKVDEEKTSCSLEIKRPVGPFLHVQGIVVNDADYLCLFFSNIEFLTIYLQYAIHICGRFFLFLFLFPSRQLPVFEITLTCREIELAP